jgi:hypothetical protein
LGLSVTVGICPNRVPENKKIDGMALPVPIVFQVMVVMSDF